MINWLQSLSGGAAAFVGSFTGAAVGLVALLLGALFNAHLNRRRDDRLKQLEARGVAAALRAELAGIKLTLELNSLEIDKYAKGFFLPDIAHSVRVFPMLINKLVLFDTETIGKIIDAHIVIEQYCEQLTIHGGTAVKQDATGRRLINMSPGSGPLLGKINENIAARLKETIERLDAYLLHS